LTESKCRWLLAAQSLHSQIRGSPFSLDHAMRVSFLRIRYRVASANAHKQSELAFGSTLSTLLDRRSVMHVAPSGWLCNSAPPTRNSAGAFLGGGGSRGAPGDCAANRRRRTTC